MLSFLRMVSKRDGHEGDLIQIFSLINIAESSTIDRKRSQ